MEGNESNNINKLQEKFGNTFNFRFKFNFNFKELPQKIIHTLREYRRVILVSKKPDIDELSKISKVAGLGILIIGFLGFLLQAISQLIK
jgi:protein transport protein SEC61 subunit gamma-like protein